MSKPEDTGLPAEASRLRQEIARRATEMHGLLDTLLGGGTLFRGQVYDAKVRCGKPTCHCATGAGHAEILASFFIGKSRKTRVLDESTRAGLQPLADRYRQFRRARAGWVRFAKEVARLLNELERARTIEVDPAALRKDRQRISH